MSTKQTKRQRIVGLERQLAESLAGQTLVYKFATEALGKVTTEHLASSGGVARQVDRTTVSSF